MSKTGFFYKAVPQGFQNLAASDGFNLLLRLVLLTWIITKFICYPLWMGDRDFPLVPVTEGLMHLPAYWHAVLFWVSLLLMAVTVIFPGRKWAAAVVVLEMMLCLLDQNRWQPWQYQFMFMLATYAVFQLRAFKLLSWQIILAGLYFFSGLAKLQPAFIHDIWNNLILRNWLGIYTESGWIFRLGYALPLLEMGGAILLCFSRFRRVGIFLLVAMHLLILLLLGPLGLNRSSVIWPWNVCMPLLLILLFYKHPLQLPYAFFKQPFAWLLVACFGILPWLHVLGRWDHYLSFTLYSGGVSQLYICTDDPAALQAMAPYMGNRSNGMVPCRFPVSAYQWGIKAMNTAPYPEERVFRSIARQWKQKHPNAPVKFYLYQSGFQPTIKEFVP